VGVGVIGRHAQGFLGNPIAYWRLEKLKFGGLARGWTGEAYQGHIFWDELFIFPFFNFLIIECQKSPGHC
jgi:hypothetical protein